jgi:CubicO group peptidase (beta-lactamase class C family)
MKKIRFVIFPVIIIVVLLPFYGRGMEEFRNIFGGKINEAPVLEQNIPVNTPSTAWSYSAPENHGMNPSMLLAADEYLMNTPSGFRSLLIVKDTSVVFEKYYNGWSADRMNNVKSVTKSVTSALVGILFKEDKLNNIDAPIGELFPEYFTSEKDKKRSITLKHLLTMTAGLAWNNNADSGSHKGAWWESTEPDKYALNISPLRREPGTTFHYNSALSHMLSSLVKKRSGTSTLDFANEKLFKPLGINNVKWDTDNAGTHRGNSELFLTARDMAKIGQLYLNRGFWNGEQIIPREWISDSFKKAGYDQYDDEYYGYQWWIKSINNVNVFYANGYGGQYICVIPAHNMVVVTTCRWDNTSSSKIPFKILEEYILPSLG